MKLGTWGYETTPRADAWDWLLICLTFHTSEISVNEALRVQVPVACTRAVQLVLVGKGLETTRRGSACIRVAWIGFAQITDCAFTWAACHGPRQTRTPLLPRVSACARALVPAHQGPPKGVRQFPSLSCALRVAPQLGRPQHLQHAQAVLYFALDVSVPVERYAAGCCCLATGRPAPCQPRHIGTHDSSQDCLKAANNHCSALI